MADHLFDRPHRTRQGAALLMGVGVIVMSIGLFFVAVRPGLLPEDIRYLARIMQRVDDCAADSGVFGKNRWISPAFGHTRFSPVFCQSLGRRRFAG